MLSGPSAVDQVLCATAQSAEGLIPIASNVVDILLCYRQSKAKPSLAAARTVRAALAVYAEALPQEGALHDVLGTLKHEVLELPVTPKAKKGARSQRESLAHQLRAIAGGIPMVCCTRDVVNLQRDLCVQLHLCNFMQSIRMLSVLNHVDRYGDGLAEPSQLFLKQVAKYLRQVVQDADVPAISWEYKLHLFALGPHGGQ